MTRPETLTPHDILTLYRMPSDAEIQAAMNRAARLRSDAYRNLFGALARVITRPRRAQPRCVDCLNAG
ncbi:MAG: hypothetical protein KDE22_15655 [Rhodobacterales bacterium]|nr:hypothetical protein [Rhodobacterales bacterium]